MTFILRDRVKVYTNTSGLGAISLDQALEGYQSFSAVGNNNQTYYNISNNVDWETGIGTYNSSTNTLSRDTVISSSNSDALVNWSAGSKVVSIPFPALASPGSNATADNSSISTDLVVWNNLQKKLYKSINAGSAFDNQGVGGIVSTYSLVYIGSGAYVGGVLAPNGDIHFVPAQADRGQKINTITGVVSTYSLVYTVGSGGAYSGGVLAPNGDIHFVPSWADRGQKINTITGVVSTYSLAYTITGAYYGGVLAPNGDIHFVPRSANRGQKISSSGVVSTYSLVYTGGGYLGGVLAPNGDIHFVPQSNRGQKINTITGVVSTYSLVYTAGNYSGGVLAPNGDIHFVPQLANRGQKINTITGVVSTYSLVYTGDFAYSGGVLAPNGDIHFIPLYANRGQKISTCPAIPFDIDICLSSFYNKF